VCSGATRSPRALTRLALHSLGLVLACPHAHAGLLRRSGRHTGEHFQIVAFGRQNGSQRSQQVDAAGGEHLAGWESGKWDGGL
jgi:hypothetical protein